MANEHKDLAQSGMLISRPESPALEAAAAEAIESAFRELIENRYLYQKIGLDYQGIDQAIRQSVKRRELQIWTSIGPTAAGGWPQKATPDRLNELHKEIEARPWRLNTRHMGDDATTGQIHRTAQSGTQPLGTNISDLNLKFYLPAVQLFCPGLAKECPYSKRSLRQPSGFLEAHFRDA